MAKPRFSDESRFPVPYVSSGKTDIRKTFARIRRQLSEIEAQQKAAYVEAKNKVRRIKNG